MEKLRPNQVRHQENLKLADKVFYHGKYYVEGVHQPNIKKLLTKGTIYQWKHHGTLTSQPTRIGRAR